MVDKTQLQVTADEFESFLSEHRDSLYELIHGEIVEKVVTEEHGSIAANIVVEIGNYLKKNRVGRVAVEARYQPEGDNVNARLPDVSFRRTTDKPVKRGPVIGMPDLAVEIKSPDDTNKQMRETAAYYLEQGCKMIWAVYPEQRLVEVYQPDLDLQILLEKDTIDGGDVLPNFQMPVSAIFE